jgi:hypothetical protein
MEKKMVQDSQEFEKRTGELRDIMLDYIESAILSQLKDKANFDKAVAEFEERLQSVEIENLGSLVAQMTIAVQIANDEVDWDN